MAKSINFRQCKLVKDDDISKLVIVSYIPDKFAKLGEYIKLRDKNGVWTNGWLVAYVSDKLISEDLLPDSHNEIKAHRKATGDSLLKVNN